MTSNLHNLGDILVVEPQGLLIAVVLELFIQGELDVAALLQLHLSGAALHKRINF